LKVYVFWTEKKKKNIKISLDIDEDIEPMPFNPKQFTTKNPFVREILETGVNVNAFSQKIIC